MSDVAIKRHGHSPLKKVHQVHWNSNRENVQDREVMK
jgi:hypothetical protein